MRRSQFCFILAIFYSISGWSTEIYLSELYLPVDTLEYDLESLDSTYSQPNKFESNIKAVFPFIWVSDLNEDGQYQFIEFQQVTPYYTSDMNPNIAVNYEFNGTMENTLHLQLNLIDIKTGDIEYTSNWKAESIDTTQVINELYYFEIPLEKITTSEYYYQILMLNNESRAIATGLGSISLQGFKPTALDIERARTDSLTHLSDSLKTEISALEKNLCCCINHKTAVGRLIDWVNVFNNGKLPPCADAEGNNECD